MNILFTCAGRRYYLLKYFKEAIGNSGNIVATDMQLSAPALTAADVKIQVPKVYATNYIATILQICEEQQIGVLISLNDLELPILSKHKSEFELLGVKVIVSDPRVVDICFDKYKTAQYIESLGLNTPKTYIDYNEAVAAIKAGTLNFPLILKPRWGSGSIGLEFVDDLEELSMVYKFDKKKVYKSILAKASSDENFLLIQEVIKGPEYGLDILNDLQGNHRGVSVKRKLAMRSGETDKAVTIDNVIIREIGATIGRSLKHIGNLDCDVLERNGEYYVLELNPRFGGGYPFSHEAGVNMPKAIIAWAKGEDVSDDTFVPEYGVMFSKCDILLNVSMNKTMI
ncbi:ATP-grasp domain-containing protein [Parabacteroides sp. AF17-3]|uniref:ATP-grasp domain-containing protein n=1 Tax=Parabacteroides sp. AF17-3 TaxID=2293113 RepID=UPI000F00B1FE|nr:ATP-grasp domain-containing protein [Parabacteroides sp. AF17-3]RKU66285.1 ATP-grasp domain-containing protein [Parabacteroides sp. AF17-3]